MVIKFMKSVHCAVRGKLRWTWCAKTAECNKKVSDNEDDEQLCVIREN